MTDFILINTATREPVPLPFHTRLQDPARPPHLWQVICIVDVSGARLTYTQRNPITQRVHYDFCDPSQVGLELISESDFMAEREDNGQFGVGA